MCGRIAQTEPSRYYERLGAILGPDVGSWRPSWNIGPQHRLLAVRDKGGERVLDGYRWGLRPSWMRDLTRPQPFNARAETIATSAMFRSAFKERRLIVPVDGFYEWHPKGKPGSQPFYFTRADGDLLALAGLWEIWRPPEGNDEVWTATIITSAAGPDMSPIHDREPVVLGPDVWDLWLDPKSEPDELSGVLRPETGGLLRRWPVTKEVGNIRNDGAYLVEPLVEPPAGLSGSR